MTIGRRYFVLFSCVILGSAMVSPPAYWLFLYLDESFPSLMFTLNGYGIDFKEYTVDRIMSRLIAVSVLVTFLWRPRLFGLRSPRQLGLEFKSGWGKEVSLGLLLSFLMLFFLITLLIPFGAREWNVSENFDFGKFLRVLTKYIPAGIFIGLAEEYFFRGVLLQRFTTRYSLGYSAIVSSFAFSAIHFIRIQDYVPSEGYALFEGFRVLGVLLSPLVRDTGQFIPIFFGLFLTGVILSYAYFYSGRLFVSVGIHGGWVLFTELDRYFVDGETLGKPWLYGTNNIIDGLIPQLGLIGFSLIVYACFRLGYFRSKKALHLPPLVSWKQSKVKKESG